MANDRTGWPFARLNNVKCSRCSSRGGKTIQNQLQLTLKTMERSGGWPQIPRLQLRTFINLLEQDPAEMAA